MYTTVYFVGEGQHGLGARRIAVLGVAVCYTTVLRIVHGITNF